MKKQFVLLITIFCLSCLEISCGPNRSQNNIDKNKLNVVVTFDSMKEFVTAVGKDKVAITTIIPAGTEPHNFEPKMSDIEAIASAKVFVYNGLGLETFAEDAISSAQNSSLLVVNASKNGELIALSKDQKDFDPHFFLSLEGAKTEVQNIINGLSDADPVNKNYYKKNGTQYLHQLDQLLTLYQKKFDSVNNKTFVTGHGAFGYFCKDFGLSQRSVEDMFAEGEPSTSQLADLVEFCKTNHVTTIFSESMASPEISQALASELGAKVNAIYTMESAEDGLSYYERMERNCQEVYQALSQS